jgi:hypothetical protein
VFGVVVEVDEVTRAYIRRINVQTNAVGIDALEIDRALQGAFERRCVRVPDGVGPPGRRQQSRNTRSEETWRSKEQNV